MPAAVLTAPGQSNTYIKDFESSGRLTVNFSRNPKKFKLARYAQIKNVDFDSGYYLQIDQFTAMNLVGGDIDEFVWPDGMPRPVLNNNPELFRFLEFRTARRNFGRRLGQKATKQAQFNLSLLTEQMQAQRAMTARTRQAHRTLELSTNWDASNRKAVNTIPNCGLWSAALSSAPYIRRSVNYAVEQIMKYTASSVEQDDLLLVMNPHTAFMISQTQELLDHIKQSPDAYDQVRGGTGKWSRWGLPDRLYGIEIVVEDAVMDTAPKGITTRTPGFVMPDAVAYLLSRPGGIEAPEGAPTFSTLTVFAYEEMSVERNPDAWNRLEDVAVVDDTVSVLTAPVAGFAFLGLE